MSWLLLWSALLSSVAGLPAAQCMPGAPAVPTTRARGGGREQVPLAALAFLVSASA
ncbi:hypothetical protein [Kibdelosporangium aridum]|uniref:hypothetical protein n=1 Tax=Kibdelosporangium aridum TaxID=2030 RepID=UPI0013573670|nr:hypothetical protein [Kibdelosporangium aridum]